jgi:uncharacterized protein YndB with AHSA1/START domain
MAARNSSANEKGLVIKRIFDAPRELLWKAWSDPEQMKRWWGPKGFTTPVCKIDFRVGGVYLYCMRSPQLFLCRDRAAPNLVVFKYRLRISV